MTANEFIEKEKISNKTNIDSLINDVELARLEMNAGFLHFKKELRQQSNRLIAIMTVSMFVLSLVIIAVIKLLF